MEELEKRLLTLASEDARDGVQGKFENKFLNAISEIGYDTIVEKVGMTAVTGET